MSEEHPTIAQQYDTHGKPIGQTRIRLAALLTAALQNQHGIATTIHPEHIHREIDHYENGKWYVSFWRTMPYGGASHTIIGADTMTDCVRAGVTITMQPSDPPARYYDQFTAHAEPPRATPSGECSGLVGWVKGKPRKT